MNIKTNSNRNRNKQNKKAQEPTVELTNLPERILFYLFDKKDSHVERYCLFLPDP